MYNLNFLIVTTCIAIVMISCACITRAAAPASYSPPPLLHAFPPSHNATRHRHCYASNEMIKKLSGKHLGINHLSWISRLLSSLPSTHIHENLLVIGLLQEQEMWLALSQACRLNLMFLESNIGRISRTDQRLKGITHHYKFVKKTIAPIHPSVDESSLMPIQMYLHLVQLDIATRLSCFTVTFVHPSNRSQAPLVETAAFALAMAKKCVHDGSIRAAYVFIQDEGNRHMRHKSGGMRIIERIAREDRSFEIRGEVDRVILLAVT